MYASKKYTCKGNYIKALCMKLRTLFVGVTLSLYTVEGLLVEGMEGKFQHIFYRV